MKHAVVPARGPRASRILVPLSSTLLKSRREGEQLALRQSACTYRRRSACVVCALPYLTSPLFPSLPLSRVPSRVLSLPFPARPALRLSLHSLLLCFCDLFVSASRVQFSRFFPPLSLPTFPRLFLRAEVVGLPRTRIRRCIVPHELCLLRTGRGGGGEGKEEGEGDNGASHLHARARLLSTSFAPKSGAPVNRLR